MRRNGCGVDRKRVAHAVKRGPGSAAQLAQPVYAVALDSAGNLFVADSDNHRVRRVYEASGFITTVAGAGDVPGIEVAGAVVLAVLLGAAIVFMQVIRRSRRNAT